MTRTGQAHHLLNPKPYPPHLALQVAGEIGDLKPIFKQMLATLQILGGLAANLKVTFPVTFRTFLDAFVQFFRFDIMGIVAHLQFGCFTTGKYLPSLLGNMLMVLAVVVLVLVQYFVKKYRDEANDLTAEDHKQHALELFEKHDTDGDGQISSDELCVMIEQVHPLASLQEVTAMAQQIFEFSDLNKDGQLTFEEWEQRILQLEDEQVATQSNVERFKEKGHKWKIGISADQFHSFHSFQTTGAAAEKGPVLNLAKLAEETREADRHSDALTKIFLVVFLLCVLRPPSGGARGHSNSSMLILGRVALQVSRFVLHDRRDRRRLLLSSLSSVLAQSSRLIGKWDRAVCLQV